MSRRGFTLVELMVGLVVAGLVLLLARVAVSQVGTGAAQLVSARHRLDEHANARRWLASAFHSLQVGQDDYDSFRGGPGELEFTARLQTPGGWFEPTRLQLARSGTAVVARRGIRDTVVLYQNVIEMETQYLLTTGAQSEWLRGWYSPATAPIAARLILWRHDGETDSGPASDTLLFLIGSRG